MSVARSRLLSFGASDSLPGIVLTLGLTSLTTSSIAVVSLGFRLWLPATAAIGVVIGLTLGMIVVRRLQLPRLALSTTVALVAISATFAVWVWLTHTEDLIVRRDAASYLQTAMAFAGQHGTPLDPAMGAFSRVLSLDPERITLTSLGFYQVDWPLRPGIQPQFLAGATGLYTIGYWAGGVPGALWVAALFGALSVLAVGVMVASWFGGPYGVIAAVATSLCFPIVYTSRTTFSEPIALFLTVCGLFALGECIRRSGDAVQAKGWGLLAVVFLVGNMLVRIDAMREVLILYLVLYVLWRTGHSAARSMLRTADMGVQACLIVWLAESWIYLVVNLSSVLPLLFAVLGLRIVLLAAMSDRVSRWSPGPDIAKRLPKTLATLTGLVWLFIAVWPLWTVARSTTASEQTAALQRELGLVVDGATYVEQPLVWVSWWVGWLALGVCAVTSVVLVHRVVWILAQRRPLPGWSAPFIIGLVSSWLILWRPGIAPDHPWADRRLVPVVVFVIVTCVGAMSWYLGVLARRTRRRVRVAVLVALATTLVVPVGMGSWPHRTERYGVGEGRGVEEVCSSLSAADAAVVLDPGAQVWTPVVRGNCTKPSVRMATGDYASVAAQSSALQQINRIAQDAGMSVAVVSSEAGQLPALLGPTTPIHHVSFGPVMVQPTTLVTPPLGLVPSGFTDLWWAELR